MNHHAPGGPSQKEGGRDPGLNMTTPPGPLPQNRPAPPNYPLRHLKYHLMQTIRPLIGVHWRVYLKWQSHIYWRSSGLVPSASLEAQSSKTARARMQNHGTTGPVGIVPTQGASPARTTTPLMQASNSLRTKCTSKD